MSPVTQMGTLWNILYARMDHFKVSWLRELIFSRGQQACIRPFTGNNVRLHVIGLGRGSVKIFTVHQPQYAMLRCVGLGERLTHGATAMLDGNRYYAVFPDENPELRPRIRAVLEALEKLQKAFRKDIVPFQVPKTSPRERRD
jgi:hypothetical protein